MPKPPHMSSATKLARCCYCPDEFEGATQAEAEAAWWEHVKDRHQQEPEVLATEASLQPVFDLMEEYDVAEFGWVGVRLARGAAENA